MCTLCRELKSHIFYCIEFSKLSLTIFFENLKTIRKPLNSMVTWSWWWFSAGKNIEKPLIPMIFCRKTFYSIVSKKWPSLRSNPFWMYPGCMYLWWMYPCCMYDVSIIYISRMHAYMSHVSWGMYPPCLYPLCMHLWCKYAMHTVHDAYASLCMYAYSHDAWCMMR